MNRIDIETAQNTWDTPTLSLNTVKQNSIEVVLIGSSLVGQSLPPFSS